MDPLSTTASIIAVVQAISSGWSIYSSVRGAKDEIKELQKEVNSVGELAKCVEDLLRNADGSELSTSKELENALAGCNSEIQRVKAKLDSKKERNLLGVIKMHAKWPFTGPDVVKIVENLEKWKASINLALNIDQVVQILSIKQKLDQVDLPIAEGAAYGSFTDQYEPECLPGTRTALLKRIEDWAEGPDGKHIFWLCGVAGTGKSTISRTVARDLEQKNLLAASFFFKRGERNRGDAAKFFTTLASQLASRIPGIAASIKAAIDADPRIPTMNLREQFNRLVLGPLSQLKPPPSQIARVVAMVDALDECDREQDQQLIVSLLASLRQIKLVEIRFFLTSRPELPLRLGFKELPECTYEELTLHEEPETEQDIELFLRTEFVKIRNYHSLPLDWPDDESLQKLVKMAVPLFVFAATACRFIADRNWDPLEQIKIVLEYQSDWHVWQLERTYLPVLHQSIIDQNAIMQEKLATEFRLIVGTILNLATPLSVSSLSRLLSVPEGTIGRRLEPLHSVLDMPRNSNTNTPIRAFHASFRDFLFDVRLRDNSKFQRFWIDDKQSHKQIYMSCIELMSGPAGLVENMCGLKSPGVFREEVDNTLIEKRLPAELRYACRYWVHHLVRSDSLICDDDQVHHFLQKYLLKWLEAMSLLDEIGKMIGTVASLNSMLHAGSSECISALLYDIKRFILQNTYNIQNAPLQVYCSALIFAPKQSLLRSIFDPETMIPWVSRLPYVQDGWGALLQTLEGHTDTVRSVAFSPNGKILASAASDKTIVLWDTNTGMPLQTLRGHTGEVHGMAFSADGKVLVSGSLDRTVRVWDVAEAVGSHLQILYGHTECIKAVAISTDGHTLASGSNDTTVRIWDAITGALMQTLESHTSGVTSVAFSTDSKILASGSVDKTTKLWDTTTGVLLQTLGGCGGIWDVKFSADNKMLALASYDGTVRLWNAVTRTPLRILKGHTSVVTKVSFSTNGKLLASGSKDQTVRLWDTATGLATNIFYGHTLQVNSVAFSPDGRVVASASYDDTVRLWDAISRTPSPVLDGSKSKVEAITFSADGKLLASAYSETIEVSDTTTGELLQTLEGDILAMKSIAFSPDSKALASAFHKTIIVRDVTTGARLQTLEGQTQRPDGIAFSPDGKLLASTSYETTVRLWDVATGTMLRTLETHTHSLTKISFSGDGNLLAAIAYDRVVRLWEVSTGTLLQTFKTPDCIQLLFFSRDSRYIYAGDELFPCRLNQSLPSLDSVECDEIQQRERYCPVIVGYSDWLVRDGVRIIWLPHDRRSTCWDVNGDTIVLGHSSGVVSIFTLDESLLRLFSNN